MDSSRHWSCVSVINPILARFKWRYPLSWDNGAYDAVWRLLAILSILQKWYSSVLIGSASNRSMTEGCSWIKSSSSASKCARRWTMKSFSGRESIKPRSRGLELRPKAEKPRAQKHRVFRYPLDGNSISLPHTDIIAQLEFVGNINPCILNICLLYTSPSPRD